MRRKSTLLSAATAALALVLLTPTGASASAEGYFYYTTKNKVQYIKDPHVEECYKRDADGHTENATNKTAYLYDNTQCHGTPIETMHPGDSEQVQFQAVYFLR
ncbi:hypothetical protein [Streptomyces sp. NPDC047315]|uniref:hypothetical protein n=1 Tax=Streptomyces sp. NPDC047315 TaxID=3155142 RepID=UPI0033F453E5